MKEAHIELNDRDKEQIVVEWLQKANNNDLLKISQHLMIRLAEEAIKMNAEVINIGTSIHPKDVDERRDIALILFQKRQSENKVKDLSSLLQTAPELQEDLQEAIQLLESAFSSYINDDLEGLFNTLANATTKTRFKESISKALGKENSYE